MPLTKKGEWQDLCDSTTVFLTLNNFSHKVSAVASQFPGIDVGTQILNRGRDGFFKKISYWHRNSLAAITP